MCSRCGWTLVDFAAACLDAGARLLQVRAKTASSRTLLEATDAIVERARGALVIVNDRADVARASGAGGVHVGQDDMPAAAARSVIGDGCVGLSTHTPDQLEAALREPVDYVAVGPAFDTATKPTDRTALGVDRVRAAARRASNAGMPIVAIGGITLERAPLLIEAGVQSVAVVSDLFATDDPAARVRDYLKALAVDA